MSSKAGLQTGNYDLDKILKYDFSWESTYPQKAHTRTIQKAAFCHDTASAKAFLRSEGL
jgi:hypothetical protein